MGIFNKFFKPKSDEQKITTFQGKNDNKEEGAFFQRCLNQRYFEQHEVRAWNGDTAFQKILELLNSGNYSQACSEAKSLMTNYKDLAILYWWWSKALLKLKAYDGAKNRLKTALECTKQKYILCNRLGEIEWEARNILEAVYWWAQGMHCQETLSSENYGSETGAYLYLYYVAEGLGLPECASAFISRSDLIVTGGERLNQQSANDLVGLAKTAKDTPIQQVLKELMKKYFTFSLHSPEDEEVNRLIQQLQACASKFWMTNDEDIKAIKRLGDIGNSRALPILSTLASKSRIIDSMCEAKDAIKKIKAREDISQQKGIFTSQSVDTNSQALTVEQNLIKAAEGGDLSTVNALLLRGGNIETRSDDGYTALIKAAWCGHTEIVKILLAAGADVNARNTYNRTALLCASEKGNIDIVKALLDKGADVNVIDTYGCTALINASLIKATERHQAAEIAKMLLAAGADVNAQNTFNSNSTALQMASFKGHPEVVKILLAADADVNVSNNCKFTALLYASNNGHAEIVKLLLVAGADANAKGPYGDTALIMATGYDYKGHIEIIKALLDNGADVNVRNRNGRTALSYASNPDIAKMLLDRGGVQ